MRPFALLMAECGVSFEEAKVNKEVTNGSICDCRH